MSQQTMTRDESVTVKGSPVRSLQKFLERELTPAQHRVHHAVNPQYLDKNYAATLCIWDRLFGTFEEEIEQRITRILDSVSIADLAERRKNLQISFMPSI